MSLTPFQRELREVLLDHPGQDNAITSTEIAREMGIADPNGNPVIRGGIRELIKATGLPIGACNQGYYLIQTPSELRRYLRDLDTRIAGIEQRKQLVREAFEREHRQAELTEVVG